MNIKKTALTLLILAIGLMGGLAIAQQERTAPVDRPQQVDAAELESLSAQPSLEQGILKLAAEKLRQEKKPMTTFELNLTVRITKAAPTCWYDVCLIRDGKTNTCLKYFYCRQD
jgi:hypothetical protein